MTPQSVLLTILAAVGGAAIIGLGRLAFANPPIYRFIAWPLAKIALWGTSIYLAYAFGYFSAGIKGPDAFSPAWVFTACMVFCLALFVLAVISDAVERQAKASGKHQG